MSTTIIILGVLTSFLFIWIFTGNRDVGEVAESKPVDPFLSNTVTPLPPHETEEGVEKLSLPRQFRRAQQSLARQRNAIMSNMKAMSHQGQVLDIQSQLVEVGTQQVALQDAMITLHQKDLDITAKHHDIELITRRGLLDINEARNKLETETIDSYKLKAENEINNSLLNLNSKEAGLEITRGQIRNELKQIENDRIGNKLSYQEQINQLNAKEVQLNKLGLTNRKDALQNISQGLDLKKKDIHLDVREGLHKLEHKTLDNKRGELNNLMGKLDNRERSIKLSGRELKVFYNELSEQFRVLLNTILIESRDLHLDRKQSQLVNKEELLQIREQKLNNLSRYIDQMHQVKNEWLRIESKGNELQYREQKIQLDNQYYRTKREVDQLRLYRYEDNLLHKEQKFELQNLYSSLQRQWYW